MQSAVTEKQSLYFPADKKTRQILTPDVHLEKNTCKYFFRHFFFPQCPQFLWSASDWKQMRSCHTSGAEDAIVLSQMDSFLLVWSYCGKKKRESGSQGYTVTKAAANKLEGAQRVHQGAEVPEAPQGQLGWHRIEACWSRARLVERSLVGTFPATRPTLATTSCHHAC